MRNGFGYASIALLCFLAATTLALSSLTQETLTPVGSSTCVECHDDLGAKMAATIHGRLSKREMDPEAMCESCHGLGSAHAESEGETPIPRRFEEKTREKDVRDSCVACHRGGLTMEWPASEHAAAGVLCTECHAVKQAYAPFEHVRQNALCASCHSDQAALFNLPSHHPVREGKMFCTDCHNPHGAEERMLLADNTNDLCFRCHAAKEGPFLYEHEPVVEDCLICHSPKGAVDNNLLKADQATLCLGCHAGHEDVHPRLDTAGLRAGYMTRCTRCHGQIHGSDLPGFVGPSRFVR